MTKVKLKIHRFIGRSYSKSLKDFKGFSGITTNGKMTQLRGMFGTEYA